MNESKTKTYMGIIKRMVGLLNELDHAGEGMEVLRSKNKDTDEYEDLIYEINIKFDEDFDILEQVLNVSKNQIKDDIKIEIEQQNQHSVMNRVKIE